MTLLNGHTGQCWDNALSKSFFASLKGELTLGYRSPAEYEEQNKITNVA